MKQCCICKQNKELSEFPKNAAQPSGYAYECKECSHARTRALPSQSKERRLDRHLRRSYGITLDQYNERLRDQSSRCAICHVSSTLLREGLCVDHDHTTGLIRGLLCRNCNLAVGNMMDSATIAASAAAYLARHVAKLP